MVGPQVVTLLQNQVKVKIMSDIAAPSPSLSLRVAFL